jgi:hypothetical protein
MQAVSELHLVFVFTTSRSDMILCIVVRLYISFYNRGVQEQYDS